MPLSALHVKIFHKQSHKSDFRLWTTEELNHLPTYFQSWSSPLLLSLLATPCSPNPLLQPSSVPTLSKIATSNVERANLIMPTRSCSVRIIALWVFLVHVSSLFLPCLVAYPTYLELTRLMYSRQSQWICSSQAHFYYSLE
jgi:hypothetical protein